MLQGSYYTNVTICYQVLLKRCSQHVDLMLRTCMDANKDTSINARVHSTYFMSNENYDNYFIYFLLANMIVVIMTFCHMNIITFDSIFSSCLVVSEMSNLLYNNDNIGDLVY